MQPLRNEYWWISWSVLTVVEIVLCIFYYNWAGVKELTYVGYALLAVGFFIGHIAVNTMKQKGNAPEGKRWIETTTLVNSGIYACVRHPQYLSWIVFSLALILIAQYWIVFVVGIGAMVTLYEQAIKDDQVLIEKFGTDYENYMKSVPRMNLLLGFMNTLRDRARTA